MTLVVARANTAGLVIAADSRACYVSRDATRPRAAVHPAHPLDGVLKAIILNHSQCVGFAGDVAVAQDAVAGILADGLHLLLDDEAILVRLLQAHVASGRAADFILASLIESARLHEVKDGVTHRNVSAAWLGNLEAFNEYQRLYLAPRDDSTRGVCELAADELARTSNAMHLLLEGERSFDDVGDFLICVASEPHGLVYVPYAIASFPTWTTTSQEWKTIDMGSAATGAYSYAVLCPTAAGIPLVAVYFAHGSFGVVFAPFHARDPILIDADTPQLFVDRVEWVWGCELRGTVILSDRALRLRRHTPAGHDSNSLA